MVPRGAGGAPGGPGREQVCFHCCPAGSRSRSRCAHSGPQQQEREACLAQERRQKQVPGEPLWNLPTASPSHLPHVPPQSKPSLLRAKQSVITLRKANRHYSVAKQSVNTLRKANRHYSPAKQSVIARRNANRHFSMQRKPSLPPAARRFLLRML